MIEDNVIGKHYELAEILDRVDKSEGKLSAKSKWHKIMRSKVLRGYMDNPTSDALEARAACLINPASGIANDYLNVFNEILLLIENLPVLLPELMEDLEQWQPISYRDYFSKSPLPGSEKALAVYEGIDPAFREKFEAKIAEVAEIARGGKDAIRAIQEESGSLEGEGVSDKCVELASRLRQALMEATEMVNNGESQRPTRAQQLADRLMELSA